MLLFPVLAAIDPRRAHPEEFCVSSATPGLDPLQTKIPTAAGAWSP